MLILTFSTENLVSRLTFPSYLYLICYYSYSLSGEETCLN